MIKKFIFGMFLLILLVGTVSAWEFDNTLDYSNNDLNVTFENAWGLPFFGSILGNVELKSHSFVNEIKLVGYGNEQVVMWYDFNFRELYSNGLGLVEFTNMSNGEILNKDYSFVYWKKEIRKKDTYEKVCSTFNKNNTKSCEYIINGTTSYKWEGWLPYNSKDIPKRNIRIGLKTYVGKNDYIDGKWIIVGKKVSLHAAWIADLNANLFAYFTLNDTASAIDSIGNVTGINNGAINGSVFKIGGSYNFTGSAYVNVTDTTIQTTKISISLWAYADDTSGGVTFISKDYNSERAYSLESLGSDKINFYDGATSTITPDPTFFNKRWVHIVVTFDETIDTVKIYIDGELNVTSTGATGTMAYDTDTQIGRDGFNDGIAYFKGIIDEVGIWNNQILSASQVSDLYNNGNAITYTTIFDTEPIISATAPPNAFNTSSQTIIFNVTANDNIDLVGINISIDGKFNQSNVTVINNTLTSFIVALSEGDHNWSVEVWDNESQVTSSSVFIFNVNTAPVINVFSPGNLSYNNGTIYFNATFSQSIGASIINYNGTNITITINNTLNVEDGNNFNLKVYANNSVTGAWGLNDTIYFSVDTTPIISVFSPTNKTYQDSVLFFNATSQQNIDKWIVNYNGTNITLSDINTTLTIEEGNHHLFLYGNNSVSGVLGVNDSIYFSRENYTFNSMTYTSSTFETKTETFTTNITTPNGQTPILGKLIYNLTTYSSATITNTNDNFWTISKTIDVPLNVSDNNFFINFSLNGIEYSTSTYSQEVNLTYFVLTNSTYTDVFLNITFQDENTLGKINASIPTSTFTYYLGTGSINKTLTYVNNTNNYYFAFSGTTGSEDLKVIPVVQYRQVSDYPQRIWQPSTQTYNSTDTNQILYLLNVNDGIFVTYQVLTTGESPIEGVSVVSTRLVSGETIQVGAGTTDSAGTVTFWENPDFQHTTTFTKTGYDEFIFVHFPTQNAYTITLGAQITQEDDFVQGVTQTINPSSDFLFRNQLYNFNYTIATTYWNLTNFQFTLTYANGTSIGSNSSSISTGGILTLNNVNISNSTTITMVYLYEIDNNDSTQISTTRVWITQTTEGTEFSIWQLVQDFNTHTSAGLYGLDDFGKTLISFIIIVLMVGGLSRRYGIASEGAIMGILFGIVFFLDVGLRMIPRVSIGSGDIVIQSIENFFTYITFIILLGVVIREERR